MTTTPYADVTVVGAGPTGLLLASELALAGVRVTVLERRTEPDPTIRAGSINVATAEILDRRGLRPAARAAHRDTAQAMAAFAAGGAGAAAQHSWQEQLHRHTGGDGTPAFPVTGHFAGILFRPELVDQTDPDILAHREAGGSTLVPQGAVETILGEHAASLGVAVRRGVEVTGLHATDGAETGAQAGVLLETSAGPLAAGWVVGADGGRSMIRKLAGVAFPGTDPETTGYQAIADLDGAGQLRPGWTWTPNGVYSYGPIPGRILTVQFAGAPADRAAPVTPGELEASIRLVSGADVRVTALHGPATRWTDNARQAPTYRAGRVLLAGDAAHVHSPFSGQGLNLGAGDAINLGWKLAATVNGWAPPGLLDTYTTERHPIGAWVLDWTRAQVALMRGDTKTRQLRTVVTDELLGIPAAMTRLVKLAAGVAQTCDLSQDRGPAGAAAKEGQHLLAGHLVGDLPLAAGGRLADHAHRGTFLLLDRTASGSYRTAAAGWADRVTVVHEGEPSAQCPPQYRSLAGLLVRPDGVIAWAAEDPRSAGAAPPDVTSLTAVLERWAGQSRQPGTPR